MQVTTPPPAGGYHCGIPARSAGEPAIDLPLRVFISHTQTAKT